jgi:quercetin dioxygenase-like cupin family protein
MKKCIASVSEAAAAMAHLATVARATVGSRVIGHHAARHDGGSEGRRQCETFERGRRDGEREKWSTVKRRLTSAAVIAALVALAAGVAVATPGSGTSPTAVARAAFADNVDLKLSILDRHQGRDIIHVRNAADTVMQQIQFGPNAISGWHSHPGPAVILIKSGQLTFYSEDDRNCEGRTFSAGEAFVEAPGLVHFAQNRSLTEVTEVGVIYFDVPADLASPRIDEPAPGNCPF